MAKYLAQQPMIDLSIDVKTQGQLRDAEVYTQLINNNIEFRINQQLMGQQVPKKEVQKWAADQAWYFFDKKGESPTEEAYKKTANYWFQRGWTATQLHKERQGDLQEAAKRGATLTPEDVVYHPWQRDKMSAGLDWHKTWEQNKSSYLRSNRVPEEDFTEFFATPAADIPNNKKISEELRTRFAVDQAIPHKGALAQDDFRTGMPWYWRAPHGMMDVLDAPSTAVAAGTAEMINQTFSQPGYEQKIWQTPLPNMEQLTAIDESKRPTKAEESSSIFAGTGGMTMGSQTVAYAPRELKKERILGVPKEEFWKHAPNIDFWEVIKNVGRGAQTFLPYMLQVETEGGDEIKAGRGSVTRALGRLRGAYDVAVTKALQDLPQDDPRWKRYYGTDDSARWAESIEMAEKRLSTGVGETAMQHLNPKEVADLATVIYTNLPRQKMLEDMIALDSWSWGISNPQAAEILHKGLLDPLWFVNPYTKAWGAAKGTVGGVKWASGVGLEFAVGAEKAAVVAEKVAAPITKAKDIVLAPMRKAREDLVHWTFRAGEEGHLPPEEQIGLSQLDEIDDLIEGYEKIADGAKAGEAAEKASAASGFRAAEMIGAGSGEQIAALVSHGRKLVRKAKPKGHKSGEREALTAAMEGKIDLTPHMDLPEAQKLHRYFTAEKEQAEAVKAWEASEKAAEAQHLVSYRASREATRAQYTLDMRAWRKAGKQGPPPVKPKKIPPPVRAKTPPPMPRKAELDSLELADLIADVAVKTGQLPSKLRKTPLKLRKVMDAIEVIVRDKGQLRRIQNGMINEARYESLFMPRYISGTDEIIEAINQAGFDDFGQASQALFPEGLDEVAEAIKAYGFADVDDAYRAILSGEASARGLSVAEKNIITTAGQARQAIPQSHWDDIRRLKYIVDDTDILGGNALHRVNPTTKSAKDRTPTGELFPWIDDFEVQLEVYGAAMKSKITKTAEMQELSRAFGAELLHKAGATPTIKSALGGHDLISVSLGGLGKATKGKSSGQRIADVAKTLGDHKGLEMVPLNFNLSKKVAQTMLPKGTKIAPDAVVFMPKVMASRIKTLLPLVKDEKKVAQVLKDFRDYVVLPSNAIWRPATTMLRAPSYFSLNHIGAVGLGFVGLGIRAANPWLQIAAHMGAVVSAFAGGSRRAINIPFKLRPQLNGQRYQWTIGEAIKWAEDHGAIRQGYLKYGMDVSAGKDVPLKYRVPIGAAAGFAMGGGPGALIGAGVGAVAAPAKYARGLKWLASHTGAQQLANFSDDYQKLVAIMGRLKNPKDPRDVMNTLDFVSEYAGNMRLMTEFERTTGRDLFTFYSWNRFIVPHLIKQIYTNPNRLKAFQRIRDVIAHNTKDNYPVTGAGVPAWVWQQGGFVAPRSMQPKPGEAAPHEYSIGIIEQPMSSMSVFAGGFDGQSPIAAQTGPAAWALIQMLTGFDYSTGHEWRKDLAMPTLNMLEDWTQFENLEGAREWLYQANDSVIGRGVAKMIPYSQAFINQSKLYGDNGMYDQQAEHWLRATASRQILSLDHLAGKIFGFEPRSIYNPNPFLRVYGGKPLEVALEQSETAMEPIRKGIK